MLGEALRPSTPKAWQRAGTRWTAALPHPPGITADLKVVLREVSAPCPLPLRRVEDTLRVVGHLWGVPWLSLSIRLVTARCRRQALDASESNADRRLHRAVRATSRREVERFLPEQSRLRDESRPRPSIPIGRVNEKRVAKVHVTSLPGSERLPAFVDIWEPLAHIARKHAALT